MGIWQRLGFGRGGNGKGGHKVEWPMLDVGYNVRELGGKPVQGGSTQPRRFLRSGDTDMLSERDLAFFREYGVRRVVDLRSRRECEIAPDDLASEPWTTYLNVPLYDFDLHDPSLDIDESHGWLASGYLQMLANRDAVRRIFSFFSEAAPGECVLFHCAAGMDRTGVTAMLLLALAGVDRERIIADYVYSYGEPREVDGVVFRHELPRTSKNDLAGAMGTMATVYDRLTSAYGSVRGYLTACGLTQREISAVRSHLVDPDG